MGLRTNNIKEILSLLTIIHYWIWPKALWIKVFLMVDCFGKTEEVVKVRICEKCRIGRRAGTPLPSSVGGLAQRVFRQFGCLPPAPPPLVRASEAEAGHQGRASHAAFYERQLWASHGEEGHLHGGARHLMRGISPLPLPFQKKGFLVRSTRTLIIRTQIAKR